MLQSLASSNQVIWANQKELAKSEELLDEQFAVSTRMVIMSVNDILGRLKAEERITAEDVETLFKDWAAFHSRPDYRNFMMDWFMGVALDTLPPPVDLKVTERGSDEGDSGNSRSAEGDAQNSRSNQAHDVPGVQAEDNPSG